MPDADEGAVARLRAALTSLAADPDDALLVAVSGGPDSMALLDLARTGWPGPVHAATVDHGLRADSAAEAAMVADFCATQGIGHAVLRPVAPITGNVQSAARKVRYALLEAQADRVGARWIVTAHHADDQLETVLMRLARGSGVDGLAGVRARNGRVLRPLLGFRKAELRDWCAARALPFVEDPSNTDRDFDRVRMRAALASFDAVDPVFAARSAAALAEAADALDWVAGQEAARAITVRDDALYLAPGAYPAVLLRRLVLICLDRVQPGLVPRGPAMDRLIASLRSGDQAMVGDVLCRGGALWLFAPAPARRNRGPEAGDR